MLTKEQVINNFNFIEEELLSGNWSSKRDIAWHEGYLAALANVLKDSDEEFTERYIRAAVEVERKWL